MMLRGTIMAVAAVAFFSLLAPTGASAGGGFRGSQVGGFHGWHGGGLRARGPVIVGAGFGLGVTGLGWNSGYEWGNPCVQPRQVWTEWGWRIAPTMVC